MLSGKFAFHPGLSFFWMTLKDKSCWITGWRFIFSGAARRCDWHWRMNEERMQRIHVKNSDSGGELVPEIKSAKASWLINDDRLEPNDKAVIAASARCSQDTCVRQIYGPDTRSLSFYSKEASDVYLANRRAAADDVDVWCFKGCSFHPYYQSESRTGDAAGNVQT